MFHRLGTNFPYFVQLMSKFSVFPREVVEKGLNRLIHCVEQSSLPHRPRRRCRNRYVSRYTSHWKRALLGRYQAMLWQHLAVRRLGE